MTPFRRFPLFIASAVICGSLLASGCATKKYVRNTVSPIDTRVSEQDKKLEAARKAIDDTENGLSTANERALSAQATADRAVKDAAGANELAGDAGRRADGAGEAASKSMARIGEVEGRFDNKLGNLDNYKVVATDEVLFSFGSADLTPAAKAKIDTLVNGFSEKKHFVVEVQGFTDKSGSAQYNLELSRKRADAVARYLTTAHQMPLWAIHIIGYGTELPAADNKTRDGRMQNRRVAVRLLAADLDGTAATSAENRQEPANTDWPQR